MSPRTDPERVRTARLVGSATAVRDATMLADPASLEALRSELPRLADAIDRLITALGDGV